MSINTTADINCVHCRRLLGNTSDGRRNDAFLAAKDWLACNKDGERRDTETRRRVQASARPTPHSSCSTH